MSISSSSSAMSTVPKARDEGLQRHRAFTTRWLRSVTCASSASSGGMVSLAGLAVMTLPATVARSANLWPAHLPARRAPTETPVHECTGLATH